MSRATLSSMANELDWRLEQVQVYAYRYMLALLNNDDQSVDAAQAEQHDVLINGGQQYVLSMNGGQHETINNEANGNATNGIANHEWTWEEDVLLDSLLAVYLTEGNLPNSNNNHDALDWEEKVASHLPGRTPMQVRERYVQLYGDRGR